MFHSLILFFIVPKIGGTFWKESTAATEPLIESERHVSVIIFFLHKHNVNGPSCRARAILIINVQHNFSSTQEIHAIFDFFELIVFCDISWYILTIE